MNWKLIEEGIGWSRKAWTRPIKNFINDNPKILFNDSLEIGASEHGTLAPFFFEGAFSKLGARKNKWRFFRPEDFIDSSCQYTFGFLSCFSFETRIGAIGKILDSAL